MKRFLAVVGAALALALGLGSLATARPTPSRFGAPAYLALGDSVVAGVGARPGSPGYPQVVDTLLESGYSPAADKALPRTSRPFDLVALAEPGATTATLAAGQVPRALAVAHERAANRDPFDDVEVVTLTIGGNDVVAPAISACVLPADRAACQPAVEGALATAKANLAEIMARVASGVGHRAEVVVTTYYNPISFCFLANLDPTASAIADVVLEGGRIPGALDVRAGLNDVIRSVAAAAGVQVADLYGVLDQPGDFVGGTDCLHPSPQGHATIGRAVYATVAR